MGILLPLGCEGIEPPRQPLCFFNDNGVTNRRREHNPIVFVFSSPRRKQGDESYAHNPCLRRGLLKTFVLAEQPGVLVTLSR